MPLLLQAGSISCRSPRYGRRSRSQYLRLCTSHQEFMMVWHLQMLAFSQHSSMRLASQALPMWIELLRTPKPRAETDHTPAPTSPAISMTCASALLDVAGVQAVPHPLTKNFSSELLLADVLEFHFDGCICAVLCLGCAVSGSSTCTAAEIASYYHGSTAIGPARSALRDDLGRGS